MRIDKVWSVSGVLSHGRDAMCSIKLVHPYGARGIPAMRKGLCLTVIRSDALGRTLTFYLVFMIEAIFLSFHLIIMLER